MGNFKIIVHSSSLVYQKWLPIWLYINRVLSYYGLLRICVLLYFNNLNNKWINKYLI